MEYTGGTSVSVALHFLPSLVIFSRNGNNAVTLNTFQTTWFIVA